LKKITIKEIALLANVSVSTVSNAINGKGKCSIETKDKIFQIMKEYKYQPNQAARTLASKKSNLIGIIFPPKKEHFKENNSYEKIITIISTELLKKSYSLVIGNCEKKQTILEWKNQLDLEGIIFLGDFSENFEEQFKELDIPIVFIDNYKNYYHKFNYINSDDTLGGFEATEILLKSNCKNIAFIGSKDVEIHNRRYLGYQSALEEYFLDCNQIFQGVNSFEGGKQIGKLIAIKNIDGLCISNDIMALGVMTSLKKLGKEIPQDVKIISFANIDSCKYVTPTLSSVDLNFQEKGEIAVQMIFYKIENICFLKNQSVDLKIIIRESTENK
jgi:DNA-binding LacI/PurR family transcriptional regulator